MKCMVEGRFSWVKAAALGSSMGMTLAGLVFGGFLLGRYLDSRWGTEPVWLLVFMLGGLVLGGVYIVVVLREFGAMDNED